MTDAPTPDGLPSNRYAVGAAVALATIVATYDEVGYPADGRLWVAPAILVVALGIVHVLAQVRRLLPVPGLAPGTLLLVLASIYLCVPETAQIRVAVMFPLLVIGLELAGRRQVGLEWYGVASAAVFWAGIFGAAPRSSALVGALFAWWAIALIGIVGLVRPMRSISAVLAVVTIGTASAWAMARTGALAERGTVQPAVAAALAAMVSFVLALVAVHLLDRQGGHTESVSATP